MADGDALVATNLKLSRRLIVLPLQQIETGGRETSCVLHVRASRT